MIGSSKIINVFEKNGKYIDENKIKYDKEDLEIYFIPKPNYNPITGCAYPRKPIPYRIGNVSVEYSPISRDRRCYKV